MNNRYQWLNEFLDFLRTEQMLSDVQNLEFSDELPMLLANTSYWERLIQITVIKKYRFVAIWAEDLGNKLQIFACFEFSGKCFLLSAFLDAIKPEITSASLYYPAANRMERHIHDMFGIVFLNHPDTRRWTRHCAWPETCFPLRKDFASDHLLQSVTPPDSKYPFLEMHGEGVYEIPVGPVHAGIIEPGHFRFYAAGEDILQLEERLGYLHKGIEKIAEGRNIDKLIKLAGRISGDSTVAYAWATCRAYESSCGLTIPERACFIRGILAERERIANHLGDFAAICNDVGFSFAYYQMMRLKELWLRMNQEIFGHRLLMDFITAQGVAMDLDEKSIAKMQKEAKDLKKELNELYVMFEENSSLHDRLKNTGKLSLELAKRFGALGFVGRSSGYKFDLRTANPYAPYDQVDIHVPMYNTGDVLARTRIRAREILASLDILTSLLAKLPDGPIKTTEVPTKQATRGIGLVEGWRGEIFIYLSFDANGLVNRYFPRDPSWFSWPLLEQLVHGNIVPDFPVCNKSINGSYSGVDL